MPIKRLALALAALMVAGPLLAACDEKRETRYPDKRRNAPGTIYGDEETVFGQGGLQLFGGRGAKPEEGGAGIGVNSFLWRASLDTVSFMPLASADPFGGVIITDWYMPPETPGERFKLSIYILDRALRADGVRVALFRQRLNNTVWIDAAIAAGTTTDIENKILTRARELRVQSAAK
jgi:Domain of unknown function (DUF3576)